MSEEKLKTGKVEGSGQKENIASGDPLRVGLLVGREGTFPGALIHEINERKSGVVAEMVMLGGTTMDEPNPYKVIIDRISHEIPYYRSYLKNAVLQGTTVINNPFWWTADDKFIESTIANRLGVAHPKTIVLPNNSYVEGVVSDSLKNLYAPLNWDWMLEYTGLPAFLKPAVGGGWKNVYKVHSKEELIKAYNETGQLTMVLQEGIEFKQYVRCYAIGRNNILVMAWDPGERRYITDPNYLSKELRTRIESDCVKLCEALGYDMNTIEFAVRDGIPYAIDFLNPAPDCDYWSVGETYFTWVVKAVADLMIGYATGSIPTPKVTYRWDSLLTGK